jgi:hypothetical protein
MRSRKTRVRRGTSPRSRPAQARRRGRVRPQLPRRRVQSRRRPYGRGQRGLQLNPGKSLRTAIMAGLLVTVLAVAAVITGGASLFKGANRLASATSPVKVAGQIVYTVRTANDSAITLPGVVQGNLVQAGLAHESIELTRVGYTGDVSTSYIDMTPRTGDSSQGPVLKVASRAASAIDAKVSSIQASVSSPGAAVGSQALYVGLTRTSFTGTPVTIISTGLDLANPDNFRSLNWSVPAAVIVAKVEKSGDMPSLHGPVAFVLVPADGPQPQLAQAQKNYLKAVWTALLKAAGATSVTFIDASSTTSGPAAPSAPAVQVPGAPATPVQQVPAGNGKVTCTVPDSFFTFNTASLADAATTGRYLAPCIKTALAAHATFALDGWTSYEGPLNAGGQPATNEPWNQRLSDERINNVANLLVNELNVPRTDITGMTGHGNLDQPNPNPRSAANRIVVITYTVK